MTIFEVCDIVECEEFGRGIVIDVFLNDIVKVVFDNKLVAHYEQNSGECKSSAPFATRVIHIVEKFKKDDCKPTNPKDFVGSQKTTFSTVPANVIAEIALGMTEGMCKYGRHNYRIIGVRASIYYDAAMRHLMAFWEGEDIDPDSGIHHISKTLSCLTVLRDSIMRGNWNDDRPPKTLGFIEECNKVSKSIIEKHKDKNPTHYTEREHGEARDDIS
jgi:hypothetical protein